MGVGSIPTKEQRFHDEISAPPTRPSWVQGHGYWEPFGQAALLFATQLDCSATKQKVSNLVFDGVLTI